MAVLDSSAWMITFRSCLEPYVVRALGAGWHLVVRSDNRTVSIQCPPAEISIVLPRGCEAVSPLWIAERVSEQLRLQATASGALHTAGSSVVAGLAASAGGARPRLNPQFFTPR